MANFGEFISKTQVCKRQKRPRAAPRSSVPQQEWLNPPKGFQEFKRRFTRKRIIRICRQKPPSLWSRLKDKPGCFTDEAKKKKKVNPAGKKPPGTKPSAEVNPREREYCEARNLIYIRSMTPAPSASQTSVRQTDTAARRYFKRSSP